MAAWGAAVGPVAHLGFTTFTAFPLALVLTYAPRAVPHTGAAAAGIAAAAVALALLA